MPIRPNKRLHQKAVVWDFDSIDDNGHNQVSAAREINVRWEQGTRDVIGPNGAPQAVDGTVFVDEVIAEGSILRLGRLQNLPTTPTDGLMEVVAFNEMPDIKGRVFIRSLDIRKYKRTLPTIV